MDGQYLVYAIVAGALLAAIALLQTISRGELSRLKVQPKPLMTPPERRVCLMIERALPGGPVAYGQAFYLAGFSIGIMAAAAVAPIGDNRIGLCHVSRLSLDGLGDRVHCVTKL